LFFQILLAFKNLKVQRDIGWRATGKKATQEILCGEFFQKKYPMSTQGLAPGKRPCFHK